MVEHASSRLSEVGGGSPSSLQHFIGQRGAIEKVRVALDACRADDMQFPHTLMVGPPGLGKSLLAKVIAAHMGGRLRETLAQTLVRAHVLCSLLLEALDRDVVFIDEADELPSAHMTLLYRSLEEGLLFVPKKGADRASRAIALSKFTLLAATNNEFDLAQPLRDRFRLVLRFDYYTPPELRELLRLRVTALRWDVDEAVLDRIAGMGRGTPRIALRLLESCRRTCRSQNRTTITAADFEQTCQMEGLDSLGLDRTEQQYLTILYESGRPVRISTLAIMLGLPPRTVSGVIEEHLVRSDLVCRSEQGRELTPKGYEHVKSVLNRRRTYEL